MIEISFPMWRGGTKTELSDVLECLPANQWRWNVLEFDGVGNMPNDASVAEFERVAKGTPLGHAMSWADLTSFAAGIHDTWWFLAVASEPGVELNSEDVRNEVYDPAAFVIRGFDSSSWEVWASFDNDSSVAAVDRLRAKFGRSP